MIRSWRCHDNYRGSDILNAPENVYRSLFFSIRVKRSRDVASKCSSLKNYIRSLFHEFLILSDLRPNQLPHISRRCHEIIKAIFVRVAFFCNYFNAYVDHLFFCNYFNAFVDHLKRNLIIMFQSIKDLALA